MTGSGSPQLAVHTEVKPRSTVVVAVDGDFDLAGAPAFSVEMRQLLGQGVTRAEVDARGATFADSSALVALLRARQEAGEAGAEFCVTATSEAVDRILDMTGLRSMLCDC